MLAVSEVEAWESGIGGTCIYHLHATAVWSTGVPSKAWVPGFSRKFSSKLLGHNSPLFCCVSVFLIVLGSPISRSDSVIHQENSQHWANTCIHSSNLTQWKARKQSQQGEKEHKAKSRGNWAHTSKNPLPVESHRTQLLQKLVVTKWVECDCRAGELIRGSWPRVFTENWLGGTFCQTQTKVPYYQKESRCSVFTI